MHDVQRESKRADKASYNSFTPYWFADRFNLFI